MHLIFLLGQTCSGKSDMAVDLALELERSGRGPVWIVNCDSRQIYRNLNLGTGKVEGQWRTVENSNLKVKSDDTHPGLDPESFESANHNQVFFYRSIPHFLIDYVDPAIRYSLIDFLQDWCRLFQTPPLPAPQYVILTGGTGLYAKAINEWYQPGLIKPEFQDAYRELRERIQTLAIAELKAAYEAKLQPIINRPDLEKGKNLYLNESDAHNPRRLQNWLLRNISRQSQWTEELTYPEFESQAMFAIRIDQAQLQDKIRIRLQQRTEQGMVREVADLNTLGPRHIELGLEYRIIWQYLLGQLTDEEWQPQLFHEIRRYAKRQLTWLNKQELHWVVDKESILQRILNQSNRGPTDLILARN